MTSTITPGSEAEVAATIRDAVALKTPLAVEGGGTRAGLGRPIRTVQTLSSRGLTGVTLYEPAELVLAARAGTPLREVEALLGQRGQRLAFEPADHRPLYGTNGEPTIGAVAAANISGPRRILAGAARDSLIGLRAVTGTGETIKSGGRVMKNVTGLDLVKFLAGSFGTLAVLTEVTFKVLPAPETEATLALRGLDDATAIAALSAALGSPFEVTGAAHRPGGDGEGAETFVRLEGFANSVTYRIDRLRTELRRFGAVDLLDATESAAVWRGIRDLAAITPGGDAPVWRISVKPGDGPAVAEAAQRAFPCRILYDWGGGLVWIAGGEGTDAGAGVIRSALRLARGHATLVRAPMPIRQSVDIFEPLSATLRTVTHKLKQTFDPAGILNPGRMYKDI